MKTQVADTKGHKTVARPYKDPPEPLSEIIKFRVTFTVREKIRAAAETANLPESEIIRRKINGLRIPNNGMQNIANTLRNIRQELARQGGLIKNLYNQNPFDPATTKSLLQTQKEIMESILPVLDKIEDVLEAKENDDNCKSGEKT